MISYGNLFAFIRKQNYILFYTSRNVTLKFTINEYTYEN